MKQTDINWFRPLWRRTAVTGFIAAWCAWEWIWTKDTFWSVLVTAALAYAVYTFFYAFPKEEPSDGDKSQSARPPEGDDRQGS